MSNYIDKNALLSSLSKQDIINICASLGCSNYKEDSNGNLCFSTALCHGGDSPYKLIYYHEPGEKYPDRKYGCFHCYTCGETYDIVELVIRAMRVQGKTFTYYKSLRYIAQITNKFIPALTEKVKQDYKVIDDFDWINRLKNIKKKQRAVPTLTEINENLLDIFTYYPWEPWMKEYITAEAMSRFEISYYGLNNSLIIPHRDINNRLIGIRQRWLDKSDVDLIGKYTPLQIGGVFYAHSLGNNLYGIHVVKEKVERCKKIMLVESEKGAMQAYSYFGEESFVVATCGNKLTMNQIKLIMSLGVEEVMLAYDREYEDAHSFEAEAYFRKLVKVLAPLVPFMSCYLIMDDKDRLPKKASPTDMGKEILIELMKEKILVTTDMVRETLGKQ